MSSNQPSGLLPGYGRISYNPQTWVKGKTGLENRRPISLAARETIAIMFVGNEGVGKSTLLNNLGGDFPTGISWRGGITKVVTEQMIDLNGERVILIDVPGVFGTMEDGKEHNVRMLNQALGRGYRYNLTFVLRASSRGFEEADLLMISKVNECVKGIVGLDVTYKVIINQIMDDNLYRMYDETVVKDNFQSLFEELNEEGYHFDIKFKSVLLLRYDDAFVQRKISESLVNFVCRWQRQAPVILDDDISRIGMTPLQRLMLRWGIQL